MEFTRKNYLELFLDGHPVIADGRSSNRHSNLVEAGEHAEQYAEQIGLPGEYEVRIDGGLYYVIRVKELILDSSLDPVEPVEAQAVFTLDKTAYAGNELTNIQIFIDRSTRTDQELTVDWAVTNASVIPAAGTATFLVGESQVSIVVAAQEVDTNELGDVTLANPLYVSGPVSNPLLGSPQTATFSIFDQSVVSDQELRDIGYLLVNDYGADPTGIVDSTTAIQNCILDASTQAGSATQKRPVYFHAGAVYKISDTIRANTYDQGDAITCHGGSKGAYPILRLVDGAANFGDRLDPRPVWVQRAHHKTTGDLDWPNFPSDPLNNSGIYAAHNGNLFGPEVMNIEIDCGVNPGAFGWYLPAAQRCFAANLRADATNALGGMWNAMGANSPVVNVELIGGEWGYFDEILHNASGESPSGTCIVGLKIVGDERMVDAIKFDGFVPCTIVGFDITFPNAGRAIERDSMSYNTGASGQFVFIDGMFRLPGGAQILDNTLSNSAGGSKPQYFRNCYVTGTDNLIQSGAEAMVTGTGTWKRINEYSYCNQTSRNAPARLYEMHNVIDGVINRTPEAIIDIDSDVAAPTVDFIARHTMAFPMPDSGAFINIEDHGAVSLQTSHGADVFGNGLFDEGPSAGVEWDEVATKNADAVEAAMAAAELAGHNRVLVPRGTWCIERTVNILKDTIFIGVHPYFSRFFPHADWRPTSNVFMFQTADDASGTCHMAHQSQISREKDGVNEAIDGTYQFAWFSFVHWRTGRHSSSVQTLKEKEFVWINGAGSNSTQSGRRYYQFTGNAGGKHYSITQHQGRSWSGVDTRQILIEGTTEPLHLYGCAHESYKAGSKAIAYNMEIRNSQNVRCYSSKREGRAPSVRIFNSQNIAYFGLGRQGVGHDEGGPDVAGITNSIVIIDGTSDNVVVAPITRDFDNMTENFPARYFVHEDITGLGGPFSVEWPEQVAVYKRGELDDAAVTI